MLTCALYDRSKDLLYPFKPVRCLLAGLGTLGSSDSSLRSYIRLGHLPLIKMDFRTRIAEAFGNSSTAKFAIPNPKADLHTVVSRWSDADVNLPALVVIASTEDDIFTTIRIAKAEKLKLIPANGAHGSFVPITDRTLYLDMKKFDTISLDQASQTVTVGGGVNTRRLVKTLSDLGYYTNFPNSNGVGIVGAMLGGGSGPFNGRHGLMIDNVQSIRLVTASREIVELNGSTTSSKVDLFNACRGAGHGLGVITAVTLQVYSKDDLNMDENKVWVRKMIFPPSELALATELYTSLLPPPSLMVPVLIFARAPPNAPRPGVPMILLTIQYFGPATEGETAAGVSFLSEYCGKALHIETTSMTIEQLNDAAEPMNRHGGFKETFSSFTKGLKSSSIQQVFGEWLKLTNEVEDAKSSYVIFNSWDVKAILARQEARNSKTFFQWRDRSAFCLITLWYNKKESRSQIHQYGNAMLQAARKSDGLKPASFINNLRKGMDLSEVYSEQMIEDLRQIKKTWDIEEISWSPVTDGT